MIFFITKLIFESLNDDFEIFEQIWVNKIDFNIKRYKRFDPKGYKYQILCFRKNECEENNKIVINFKKFEVD